MKNDLQKRITELLEENQKYYERCLESVEVLTHKDKNFVSYCKGCLCQATYNFENLKEMCLHDISLETYVAMIESTLKTFAYMLETMVEPVFGKDTPYYNYFEGRVDETREILKLLQKMLKEAKER